MPVFFYSFYAQGHTLTQVHEVNKKSMGAGHLHRSVANPFFGEDVLTYFCSSSPLITGVQTTAKLTQPEIPILT